MGTSPILKQSMLDAELFNALSDKVRDNAIRELRVISRQAVSVHWPTDYASDIKNGSGQNTSTNARIEA